MTTLTPRASINGGGWQYGGITGLSVSDSVQLGRDPTDGIKAEKYEIYGYPPDFALPSGWTDVGGIYTHLGADPDAFTLTYWGVYLVRVTATLTSPAGETVTDSTLALLILSPTGIEDVAPGEASQFGYSWAVAFQKTIRIWDSTTSFGSLFGDGGEGVASYSSGTITLQDDRYWSSLTLSGTARIITNGYRIFVSETLDITNAQAAAIVSRDPSAKDGANGYGTTGGAGAAASASACVGGGGAGGAGANSSIGAGVQGSAGDDTDPSNGGSSNDSGAGGAGTAAGGALRAGSAITQNVTFQRYEANHLRGATIISGGAGGPGGSSGGGDTSSSTGGAGGGGGGGGASVFIAANEIARSDSTPGVIDASAGDGGDGVDIASANCGGGGGAAGGGGGWVYIAYRTLSGTTNASLISAAGGAGGDGGDAGSGATGGDGGDGGDGGTVTTYCSATNAATVTTGDAGSAGSAAAGTSGGAGGAGGACDGAL